MQKQKDISFSIIVKNEEKNIEYCLESILPVAGEIIVVDTGSTDRTVDICREFTDKIYEFKWNDNFSAARNFAKSKCRRSWIFIIDADEILSKEDYTYIKNLTNAKDINGYIVDTVNYSNKSGYTGWRRIESGKILKMNKYNSSGYFFSPKIRLFRNLKNIRFKGHVHEHIDIKEKVKDADFYIYHYGYILMEKDKSLKQKKLDMYELLGEKKLDKQKSDNKSVFELAKHKRAMGKPDEAIELFEKLTCGNYRKAAVLSELGLLYSQKGNNKKSEEYLKKAVESDPEKASYYINLSYFYYNNKDLVKAREILNETLKKFPDHANAYFNIGVIDEDEDRIIEAVKNYKKALDLNLNMIDCIKNMIILYSRLNMYNQAGKYLDRLKKLCEPNKFTVKYENLINKGIQKIKKKEDVKSYKNGLELYNSGDYKKSIKYFRKCLKINPDCVDCYIKLSEIYKHLDNNVKRDNILNELEFRKQLKELI